MSVDPSTGDDDTFDVSWCVAVDLHVLLISPDREVSVVETADSDVVSGLDPDAARVDDWLDDAALDVTAGVAWGSTLHCGVTGSSIGMCYC